MIDPKKIAEWKALVEKAAQGPWRLAATRDADGGLVHVRDIEGASGFAPIGRLVAQVFTVDYGSRLESEADATAGLIVAAREALPALLAEREELIRECDTARSERGLAWNCQRHDFEAEPCGLCAACVKRAAEVREAELLALLRDARLCSDRCSECGQVRCGPECRLAAFLKP